MDENWTAKARTAAFQIDELKVDMALIRLRLALRSFNPDEPRWPAGQINGGQWRATDGMGHAQPPASTAGLEGAYDPGRMSMCLVQQLKDEELCRMVRSDRCWESSQMRYNNCMRNVYIPPLEIGR